MDSASSSNILHNPDESKQEIINEKSMEGKEDISDMERLYQRMLEIQPESIELLKSQGKGKESSFTEENSPMDETTTIPRIFRQEGIPLPFSRLMNSSTPFTSHGPNTLSKRVKANSQTSSPLEQESPRNNTPIFKIRPKDYNLWFDGKEVEIFIDKVENIAEIEEASVREISTQIFFWTKDQNISYNIEAIPGYETGDWEKLKLEMKRIWGTISPERRYKISSINQLSTNIQHEGGIGNMNKYKTFIGEYESIINYLKMSACDSKPEHKHDSQIL
ncbi:hypothetical protein O181_072477 [Austropuccinia psidii MF-1]|uniref:Uncharacterized protein n=1 Tax=Austropuccinia psidii MF-1 TaxID=1389203 RepID=A0A9Q3F781_9BASI|nr:hypothetical protein [Austropuccinia psidii MF-1]